MSNRSFYEANVPSFTDPERSAGHPGFRLEIVERDTGIGIGLSGQGNEGFRMCFINHDDAEKVIAALRAAAEFAKSKLGDRQGYPRLARET